MKRSLLVLVVVATLLLLAACTSISPRVEVPPVSPEEIVELAKKGETTAAIIAKIQHSETIYNLTASQFVQLAKDGVPDAVLDHMQQTYIKAVERNARREAYNDLWFASYGWYGHPWHSHPRIIYVPGRRRL